MPNETVWAKRARKVRAAQATQRAETAVREAAAQSVGDAAPETDIPLSLPAVLDLAAAAPLARALLERRGKPTVVDAVGIQRPGAASLQVLLAAVRTWEGDSVPLTFINCGPLFIEHLRFLGVVPDAFLKGAQS